MGGAGTREALAAGLDVARAAWRRAWAPPAVCTLGWTAVFVAGRARLPPDAGAALGWTGLALVLLMTPPKLGALARLAAGAEARDSLGAAGLQWTALEGRLAATATALAAAGALVFAAGGAAAAAALEVLQPLGRVGAGPFGTFAVGFLLLSPALLAGAAAAAWTVGRLDVTLAADAAEPGARFARGWLLTRGAGAAPAAVWLAAFALPCGLVLLAPTALDALGGGGRWSAAEGTVVGGALAAATQFLCAPVHAGALAQLRRAGLAREAAAPTVDTHGTLGDKAAATRPAAPPPEPLTA